MPPDPPTTPYIICVENKNPRTARAAWPHQKHSMCAPPSSTSGSAPVNSSSETTDKVDQIFKELKSKHIDIENTKLRLSAKLIENNHYNDLENPLQIPLITGSSAPAKKER